MQLSWFFPFVALPTLGNNVAQWFTKFQLAGVPVIPCVLAVFTFHTINRVILSRLLSINVSTSVRDLPKKNGRTSSDWMLAMPDTKRRRALSSGSSSPKLLGGGKNG